MNEVITLYPKYSTKYGNSYMPESIVTIAPLTLSLPPQKLLSHEEINTNLSKLTAIKYPDLPKQYDIRKDGKYALKEGLTHVLNQGSCGSCWAFSVASAASDIFTKQQLKSHQLPYLI